MKSQEIIAKDLEPLAERATTIVITDQDSLKEATSILSQLNNFNDQIEAEQDKVLAPLKEAMKAEKERWKPAITYYKAGIEAIRLKMSEYQTNLVNTVKKKESVIAARIGAGKGKLTLETASKQLSNLPTIEKETATDEGLVQFREKQVLKIVDLSLIPDEYWRVEESELLADLKQGKVVPGCKIEIIQVAVNYR